jgi:hypothetical protein
MRSPGSQIFDWNIGYRNLAQLEEELFPTAAYAWQDIVGKVARAGRRLTGKAISVVHVYTSLTTSSEQFTGRSWKASIIAFWLYANYVILYLRCQPHFGDSYPNSPERPA